MIAGCGWPPSGFGGTGSCVTAMAVGGTEPIHWAALQPQTVALIHSGYTGSCAAALGGGGPHLYGVGGTQPKHKCLCITQHHTNTNN